MKGVLIATDFVKDNDGVFKILETNTSIAIAPKYFANYFNEQAFKQFVIDNNINEVYILTPYGPYTADVIDLGGVEGDSELSFRFVIEDSIKSENISFDIKSSPNSLTPYFIEDSENKLIIRMGYDQNALIDETYARDNFEFLKLLSDNDSDNICPFYFNDGNGMVVNKLISLRDNGVHPNYIIKKRYPTTDYGEYPKILKVSSLEDLNTLIDGLSVDEILQEYVINSNDLLEGKLKTYRTVQMVYGSNLDVFDFMEPFVHTNKIQIDELVDYDMNGYIERWERPKYLQKVSNTMIRNTYHTNGYSTVITSDETLAMVDELMVGDHMKTYDLYNLSVDDEHHWRKYSLPSTDVFSGSTISTTQLVDKKSLPDMSLQYKITLDGGVTFVYSKDAVVLRKDNEDNITFIEIVNLSIGDILVLNNINNDQFLTKEITNIEYYYKDVNRTFFDVEDIDLYLKVNDDLNPQYYMINHNPPGFCECWIGTRCAGDPCLTGPECTDQRGTCFSSEPTCRDFPLWSGSAGCDGGQK